MRRERFEAKYLFPLENLDKLRAYIRPFMGDDKYSDRRDKVMAYKVRSLYFDSKSFDFYRTHVERYQSRRKIRIRKYTYLTRGHYFLEIKNKVLFSTNKYRMKIDSNLLRKAVECKDFSGICKLFCKQYYGDLIAEIIHFDISTLKVEPVLFISYDRQAYNSRFEHDVRLTVDSNVYVSKAISHLRFDHKHVPQRILPASLGILELKANATMPQWLRDVIVSFKLSRISFSKYKQGIECIYNI